MKNYFYLGTGLMILTCLLLIVIALTSKYLFPEMDKRIILLLFIPGVAGFVFQMIGLFAQKAETDRIDRDFHNLQH